MDTKADSNSSRTAPAVAPDSHTPGPWRVDCSYPTPSVIAHCFPNGATCVAVVYGDKAEIMARVPGGAVPESVANARLIAAAPELLSALRELARAWDAQQLPVSDRMERALVDADKAIANAEGR